EAVDRLLRIADQEELARNRAHAPPVAGGRVVRREEQENLRLQRVGVLELVDEDVREPALQLGTDRRVVADQVAGAEQQVDEVEAAGAALQGLVSFQHGLELVAEAR